MKLECLCLFLLSLYMVLMTNASGLLARFTRDNDVIVGKISKILKDKFTTAYYSWTCVPTDVQDRYFRQLAYVFNWDPMITSLVREGFEEVAQRRLKGLISYVRRYRRRPRWIGETLFLQMEAHWNTKAARRKSKKASECRLSQRDGLGPHVHVGGPKSHAQIKREMEKELGRPVAHGEVFMKTHTRKDGSFTDNKSKMVGEKYNEIVQAKLSEIVVDASAASDGASQAPQLTKAQLDAIFVESTFKDGRGNLYGLGSLSQGHRKGKGLAVSDDSFSTITELREELADAKKMIALQAKATAKRDAEAEESKMRWEGLMKYLKERDPNLPPWIESCAPGAEAGAGAGDGDNLDHHVEDEP